MNARNHSRAHRSRHPTALLLALLLASCSPKPDALLQTARRAEAQSRIAFEHHDSEGAGLAAARAEVALAELEHLFDSGKARSGQAVLQDTRAAAAAARNYAQLACEQDLRLRKLASLKLKLYQSARATVCSYGFAGLAPAVEQLARFGTNLSAASNQPLAAFARSLVESVSGPLSTTNSFAGWPEFAATLRAWGSNPPPAAGLVLALGFAAAGFTDFALAESESVDASRLTGTNALSCYHLERCGLFALSGWDRSAARELDQALALSPNGWHGVGATQALALFHFWLADHALQRGHHLQAGLELEQARRAWPDSPLAVFLVSEQLALSGQWQRAADLLDAQAAAAKSGWLAKRLSQRAAQLRDRQAKTPPLFTDVPFILDCIAHIAGEKAAESVARTQLQHLLDDAKAFGQRLADKLPGSGAPQ